MNNAELLQGDGEEAVSRAVLVDLHLAPPRCTHSCCRCDVELRQRLQVLPKRPGGGVPQNQRMLHDVAAHEKLVYGGECGDMVY